MTDTKALVERLEAGTLPIQGEHCICSDRLAYENCPLCNADKKICCDMAEAAAEITRLQAELDEAVGAFKSISEISAGGPHISAEEGVKANWSALMRCREIARAFLTKQVKP